MYPSCYPVFVLKDPYYEKNRIIRNIFRLLFKNLPAFVKTFKFTY